MPFIRDRLGSRSSVIFDDDDELGGVVSAEPVWRREGVVGDGKG